MFGQSRGAAARKDHASCSGCSLCLLVCPTWRATHDPRMTPEGRAKALQHGATPADVRASVELCTLCAACEPVCPEKIDLVGLTLDLRRRLADGEAVAAMQAAMNAKPTAAPVASRVILLAGRALRAKPEALKRTASLVRAVPCEDGGEDILEAIEAGVAVQDARLQGFLAHLRPAKVILVDDGLWLRHLRQWLPRARLVGLGEALTALASVRMKLRKTDLYVIEPRAYHDDYQRLVRHYDRLRADRGCEFNLDLQRIAISASGKGQAEWILKGRRVERIVVERHEDAEAFAALGTHPVVHAAELADH